MSKVVICRLLLHLSSTPEKYPKLLQWSPLSCALLADSHNTSIYSSLHPLLAFHILHNHSLLQENSSLLGHDYPSQFCSSCKFLKQLVSSAARSTVSICLKNSRRYCLERKGLDTSIPQASQFVKVQYGGKYGGSNRKGEYLGW